MTEHPTAVRDAGPGDAAALAEMANALARITARRAGAMTAETVRRDLLRAPGLGCLVAETRGAVAGYALYTPAYETAFAARGLYLSDLFVRPEARRRGLARALLAETARRAEAEGGRFVWWVADPGDAGAHAFYDRLGASREALAGRAVFGCALDRLLGRAPLRLRAGAPVHSAS